MQLAAANGATGVNNFTTLANTTVCSAIEFNGIFNNAANTLTNFTFNCLSSSVATTWNSTLTSCSGTGVQNCGAGACCATRNGTLFGYPMTSSQVCQPAAANSGSQIMYGYAAPYDVSINYGWGEIDSNCNLPAVKSFGKSLRVAVNLIAFVGVLCL